MTETIEAWFDRGDLMLLKLMSGEEIIARFREFRKFNDFQTGYVVSQPMRIITFNDENTNMMTNSLVPWLRGTLANDPDKEILIRDVGVLVVDKPDAGLSALFLRASKGFSDPDTKDGGIRYLTEHPGS